MSRAVWTGSVGFGLVRVPVKMFVAVDERVVRFCQVNKATGNVVKQPKVDAVTGKPVEGLLKGYVFGDRIVTIEPTELEALGKAKSRQMEIEKFVDASEIDPIYVRANHWLAPGAGGWEAYALLADALESTGKVGIGRYIKRGREQLVALRARSGVLLASDLVFADEIRDPSEHKPPVEAPEKMRAQARMLVEALTGTLDHETYQDEYRKSVLDLIERKCAGQGVVLDNPPEDVSAPLVDLSAALEASVKEMSLLSSDVPRSENEKMEASRG